MWSRFGQRAWGVRCRYFRWIGVVVVGLALAMPGVAVANHNLASLASTGPAGGNGPNAAGYRGASEDGTRVFFQTDEPLIAGRPTRRSTYTSA